MVRPHHVRRFAPRLLELESRDVPAGNVTITQLGTELRVIGDAEANSFTIRGRGPGVVEIQGHNTTINGANAKVTATGVEWLRAAGRANNDVIKTRDLEIAQVNVFGEGGNDVLELSGTRGVDLPSYYWDDRGLDLYVGGGSGDDTIRVTGTDVQGNFAAIGVEGDDGQNSITISDTNVEPAAGEWGGFLYLSVYNGYGSTQGANEITVQGLEVDAVAPDSEPYFGWNPWYIDIHGADGDDQFRFRNWDLSARGNDTDLYGDTVVVGWGGADRIEVENASWSMTTPAGIGRSNQNSSYFDADQVTMRNVRHEGGTFDGTGYSGSFLFIGAVEADLRNVAVTSATGFATLGLSSPFDDPTRAASFTLANVTVSGGEVGESTYIYTGEGNDSVRVTNSELGDVDMNLGEGDDSLTFVNVAFSAPHFEFEGFEYGGIFTGGGDDTVSLTNCDVETVYIDTGDGDDTVNMTNCVFVTADLFGGDGTDDLNLINNTGLFDIDGFEE
jgi:hypothetical protein